MNSPLPYTIRDMMLDPGISCFVQNNLSRIADYEAREAEFRQLFGIDLVFFVHPIVGFQYTKFTSVILDPVPDGISYNTATASRFGVRAAELIGELIHAGERKI